MISTKYGQMNVIPADKIVSHSLSLYGEWAGDELNFLSRLITPGMHVLDIGAFIGTHTLAFAHFVGAGGKVYSFEPRKEIFQILCSNVKANGLECVLPFNMGLAEIAGSIALEPIDIEQSVNFGGLSIESLVPKETAGIYEVKISTVDALLNVPSVDFMKLDVEGMERKVLDGAQAVIARDQPLIFCECNSISSGYELFEFCEPLNYCVYGIVSAAYNPANFNGVEENIFGDAKEISLLLIPRSKVVGLDASGYLSDIFEIKNLEDFVLPLLHKPQYAHEVLAGTSSNSLLGLNYPSPLLQVVVDGARRDKEEAYNKLKMNEEIIVENSAKILQLNSQLTELTELGSKFKADVELRQQQIYSLHADIQNLLSSTSWRVTKPLRLISAAAHKFLKLGSTVVAYNNRYLGLSGVKKLIKTVWAEFRSGGLRGLKKKYQLFLRFSNTPILVSNVEAAQSASPINELSQMIERSELFVDTIIFDHNGGGGSNTYTSQLIESTVGDSISILRVYCWGGEWYVQVRNTSELNNTLYCADDLAILFACLNISRSKKLVVNSLYGYKSIDRVIEEIVQLKKRGGCSLNFKVHDFHALCPSPHLSDFEQKYCRVPANHEVCKGCLPKNLNWYHSWYSESDRATDIDLWRAPFQRLFDACSVITCFDESSIDILRTDFEIDQAKIDVVPHELHHFACTKKLSLDGPLSIGVIGTLSHIKGGDVIKELCSHMSERGIDIPITIIGQSYTELPENVKVFGSYIADELPSLIETLRVNVIFMASIVPETFSYTISEAIEMGLPVVAFDIGAQGRRVKEYNLGKVVPVGASSEEILNAVQSIYKAIKE